MPEYYKTSKGYCYKKTQKGASRISEEDYKKAMKKKISTKKVANKKVVVAKKKGGGNVTEAQNIYTGINDWVTSMYLSDNYLFTGSSSNIVKMWDISATPKDNDDVTEPINTFPVHDYVTSVFVSEIDNKKYLFTASWDKTARMFDTTNGELVRTFEGHTSWVTSVCVSGKHVFTGSKDKTAKMFDATNGQLVHTFKGHIHAVNSVFVSGDYLFTGSDDFTAKMWNTSTGALVKTFTGHLKSVRSVFVSGNYLFTGSDDKTAMMWDISATPTKPIKTFKGHADSVVSVFVLAGKQKPKNLTYPHFLFTGSPFKVKMWNLEPIFKEIWEEAAFGVVAAMNSSGMRSPPNIAGKIATMTIAAKSGGKSKTKKTTKKTKSGGKSKTKKTTKKTKSGGKSKTKKSTK